MRDSSPSISDSIASFASEISSQSIQREFAVAVLKQIQDIQKQQADALLKMINQSPSPEGIGKYTDMGIQGLPITNRKSGADLKTPRFLCYDSNQTITIIVSVN